MAGLVGNCQFLRYLCNKPPQRHKGRHQKKEKDRRKKTMKIKLMLAIVLCATCSQAEEFDFIFVHKAECYNFSEDSIDYCRIVNNQKDIRKLSNALEKSRSHQYLCGYEHSFEFVKNNKIVKSIWIQPSCEKNKLLDIISPYFPVKTDSFFVYLKASQRAHQQKKCYQTKKTISISW
jgi:hypothetical protein